MKKLVTALIVVLPLIFVVAIFAVTSVARISTTIPVTGLQINYKGDGGAFEVDLANYTLENRIYEDELDIEVLPSVAGNKNFDVASIVDSSTNEATDIVSVKEDENERRYFDITGVGNATVTYASEDGGFTDSVQFVITSTGVLSFAPVLKDEKGKAIALTRSGNGDYSAEITSGSYAFSTINEPNIPASVKYTTSSPLVELDAVTGALSARFSGNADINISIGSLSATVHLAISLPEGCHLVINGKNSADEPHFKATEGTQRFLLWLESDDDLTEEDISVLYGDAQPLTATISAVSGTNGYQISVELPETSGALTLTLSAKGVQYPFHIDFGAYAFTLSSSAGPIDGDLVLPRGNSLQLSITSDPRSDNLSFEWSLEGRSGIAKLENDEGESDNYRTISGSKLGSCTLKITWRDSVTGTNGLIERTVKVVQPISSIFFNENAETYGLGSLAIASKRYSSDKNSGGAFASTIDNWYQTKLRVRTPSDDGKTQDISGLDEDDFEVLFSSDVASYKWEDDKLLLHALATSDGPVSVTVKWKYGDLSAQIKLQTVDGIAVGGKTYDSASGTDVDVKPEVARDQLTQAMNDKLAVVLDQDVYLGEDLYFRTLPSDARGGRKYKNDSEMLRRQELYLHDLPTTWDWTYYKNLGSPQPTVKYALEFTANVYGNGHQINAEYLTNTTDTTGNASYNAFKGPLNFVSVSQDLGGGATMSAAVKGQDNIVFLVREKGLTLDNVVLKSCNDVSLYSDDPNNPGKQVFSIDLLNYMGTTLEIMNDCTLLNSRVMNGRTVLRIYGKDGVDPNSPVNAAEEKIKVEIDGCVLQNAREFILKMGTNRFLRGSLDDPAPILKGANGVEYGNCNSDDVNLYLSDDYFVNNLVLTDVTLKDTTLSSSGLFAIGLESHFAGEMLAGGGSINLSESGWRDLAATSYPAVLHLKGKVVLNNWKNIGDVNSDTLIESAGSAGTFAFLKLDISKLLQFVSEAEGAEFEKFRDLIAKGVDNPDIPDGKMDAVHGGIALYGGGRNYHIVDFDQSFLDAMPHLSSYNINIDILTKSPDSVIQQQGQYLPQAAGTRDFRFLMYSSGQYGNAP